MYMSLDIIENHVNFTNPDTFEIYFMVLFLFNLLILVKSTIYTYRYINYSTTDFYNIETNQVLSSIWFCIHNFAYYPYVADQYNYWGFLVLSLLLMDGFLKYPRYLYIASVFVNFHRLVQDYNHKDHRVMAESFAGVIIGMYAGMAWYIEYDYLNVLKSYAFLHSQMYKVNHDLRNHIHTSIDLFDDEDFKVLINKNLTYAYYQLSYMHYVDLLVHNRFEPLKKMFMLTELEATLTHLAANLKTTNVADIELIFEMDDPRIYYDHRIILNNLLFMIYKLPEHGINKFTVKIMKYREKVILSITHSEDIDIRLPELVEFMKLNLMLDNYINENCIYYFINLDKVPNEEKMLNKELEIELQKKRLDSNVHILSSNNVIKKHNSLTGKRGMNKIKSDQVKVRSSKETDPKKIEVNIPNMDEIEMNVSSIYSYHKGSHQDNHSSKHHSLEEDEYKKLKEGKEGKEVKEVYEVKEGKEVKEVKEQDSNINPNSSKLDQSSDIANLKLLNSSNSNLNNSVKHTESKNGKNDKRKVFSKQIGHNDSSVNPVVISQNNKPSNSNTSIISNPKDNNKISNLNNKNDAIHKDKNNSVNIPISDKEVKEKDKEVKEDLISKFQYKFGNHICMDVLLVDDELINFKIYFTMFKKFNLTFVQVVNKEEMNDLFQEMLACPVCCSNTILLMMDYRLKNDLGTRLLGVYKEEISKLNLKVFGLTSTEEAQTIQKYRTEGAIDIFFKPLQFNHIKRMLVQAKKSYNA